MSTGGLNNELFAILKKNIFRWREAGGEWVWGKRKSTRRLAQKCPGVADWREEVRLSPDPRPVFNHFLRFYHEIQSWPDCDPSNSHWFKNKQDNTWVGVRSRYIFIIMLATNILPRYGWAIVSFHSQQGRNAFLEDENRHFVRESKDDVWERLKVNPKIHIL